MFEAKATGVPEPRVTVVIPTLNEAANLPYVLAKLPPGLHEVILVDGGSTDDTIGVAKAHRDDIVVMRQTRRGKGNALACGFAAASGDIVVMLDADGSADPAEIGPFVAALVDGADFAKGTRFASGGSSHDITHFRRWGNRWLNLTVNLLFRAKYTDLCYGYNAFWTRLLPLLDLPPLEMMGRGENDMTWGDGFEIETLINIRMAMAKVAVTEVGSVELVRLHGESNLKAIPDGMRVLRTAIHERFSPSRRRAARKAAREYADRRHGTSVPTRMVIDLRDSVTPSKRIVQADGSEVVITARDHGALPVGEEGPNAVH